LKTVGLGAIIFGTDLPSKEETEVGRKKRRNIPRKECPIIT
jgi:hypothetical protein